MIDVLNIFNVFITERTKKLYVKTERNGWIVCSDEIS